MFTKKNLFILVGRHALIMFAAVGITIIVLLFFTKKIELITSTVIKNRNLVSMLEKRTELFSTLKRDTLLVGTNDKQIESAFPPADNILEFISVLDSLALKNGVTQSFHFDNPTPASDITAPFPLSIIGYSNSISGGNVSFLSNYLKGFEGLPYFTKINSLNITSSDETGWHGASTASFRAVLYTKAIQ